MPQSILADPIEVIEALLAESMDRPTGRVCPGCNGEGGQVLWTRGSKMPDPQTEITCDLCEGSGVVPR